MNTVTKLKASCFPWLWLLINCSIEKVEVRALSDDELSKTVAEYQRADGQFVYNGIFMPREKIVETIKSKYVVLLIVVKHQVDSSEDTVFELNF